MKTLATELRSVAHSVEEQHQGSSAERLEIVKVSDQVISGAENVAEAGALESIETLLLETERRAAGEPKLLATALLTGAAVEFVDAPIEGAVAALLRFALPTNKVTESQQIASDRSPLLKVVQQFNSAAAK